MELEELRYFVRVAEHGSFTQAALRLNMTQPALSKKIRALEVELRTHLFRRNGRGVHLTTEGRRFLDHARGLLQAADAAVRSLRSGEERYEGHLAIGLPPSIGRLTIPPLLIEFARRFPKATLSVVEGLSHTLYDQILSGRLDFAVTRNPSPSPHVSVELLTTESFYLVGAKPVGRRREVTLQDLATLRFILPTAPHSFRQLLESATAHMANSLDVRYEVDGVTSLLNLASAGLGYTIVPESTRTVAEGTEKLSWQRIAAPEIYTTLCFISSARKPEAPLVTEAGNVTRELVKRELRL